LIPSAGFAAARAVFRAARDFGFAVDRDDVFGDFEADVLAVFALAMMLSCLQPSERASARKAPEHVVEVAKQSLD
jgi:hypothetical protein